MSTEPTVADVFWAQIARVEAIKLAKTITRSSATTSKQPTKRFA